MIIDPHAIWTLEPAAMVSLGTNTPLLGRALTGRVVACAVDGELRLDRTRAAVS